MIPEDNPTSAHLNTSLAVHIKTQASYGVLNNRAVLMWEMLGTIVFYPQPHTADPFTHILLTELSHVRNEIVSGGK